jgi:hypothetical protein
MLSVMRCLKIKRIDLEDAFENSRGGDVFLADTAGNYFSRTCPWKECGPGIRMSRDALHCGRRHYLHDDLRAIKLQPALIQAPPIELWPAVVARVDVPADVEELLLKSVRAGLGSAAAHQLSTKPEGQRNE